MNQRKNLYNLAYAKRNRARVNERNRNWHKANPSFKRDSRILHLYGLTPEDYAVLVDKQHGVCLICLKPPDPEGKPISRYLHVDHDHRTGRVRGLLCGKCNTALGQLADDPERMRRMIDYVERSV